MWARSNPTYILQDFLNLHMLNVKSWMDGESTTEEYQAYRKESMLPAPTDPSPEVQIRRVRASSPSRDCPRPCATRSPSLSITTTSLVPPSRNVSFTPECQISKARCSLDVPRNREAYCRTKETHGIRLKHPIPDLTLVFPSGNYPSHSFSVSRTRQLERT